MGASHCHGDLWQAVEEIVQSTGLGQCFCPPNRDFPWAVWHVRGFIFAYARGQSEVGYLVEETDGDHPAGSHWQAQSLLDPDENLDRNIKNALRLVFMD